MANIYIGTSGFQYKDWEEKFYPSGLHKKDWLKFFSSEFSTVEINGYAVENAKTLINLIK